MLTAAGRMPGSRPGDADRAVSLAELNVDDADPESDCTAIEAEDSERLPQAQKPAG